MKTLKITLAALSFCLMANLSMAQTATAEEKAAKQTEKMSTELVLTPEQRAQVADINLNIERKNEAVRNDQSMSEETKKQSYQGNNDARIQMIKPLLTPEQATKFDEMHKAKQQKAAGRGSFDKLIQDAQKEKATPEQK